MKDKCAAYIRISSDLQDYERQIADMKQFCKTNNLILLDKHLYEDKLSGFKNEDEREGIRKLKIDVLEFGIKTVLVWEISRLARKHMYLLQLTDFFQKNEINVYFIQQRFWLLDETLNISPQAGLSIAFFGWHGEYEARLTKERFISAKKLNESMGKYNGGKITFGYTLDKNNQYIINNELIEGLDISEAGIVKEMFDLYEEGLTCSKICRINRSKGYPKIVCNTHTLARVLRETSYIGYKNVKLGKRPTPKIISNSQYNRVADLIDQNKTKADKGLKHVYLLRGIIKCSYCGSYYVGKQTDDAYICPQNSGSNKTNKGSSCKGSNISTSNIDGVIWERAKFWLMYKDSTGFDDTIEGSEEAIEVMQNQIENYNSLIAKTEQRRKKINIIFQNDGFTVEEYQKALNSLKKEKKNCNKEIENLESKIEYLNKLRKEAKKLTNRKKNIESITDRNQIKTILKGLIDSIETYKCSTHKTVVSIRYFDGNREIVIYNSVAKKANIFKLLNPWFIRFDSTTRLFYLLKESHGIDFTARSKPLKERGVGNDLADIITLQDFARQIRFNNISDVDIQEYLEPYPNKDNSYVLDFDGILNHEDINHKDFINILSSEKYSKITYFKDLNEKRFSRKKSIKPHERR